MPCNGYIGKANNKNFKSLGLKQMYNWCYRKICWKMLLNRYHFNSAKYFLTNYSRCSVPNWSQPDFMCSKSAIKTLEEGMESVQI